MSVSIGSETRTRKDRARPFVFPQLCKACGRCIEACPKKCIHVGSEIDARTGLTPVEIDLEACNGCGLCFEACPEPYGLMPLPSPDFDPIRADVGDFLEEGHFSFSPEALPATRLTMPRLEPMVLKGTHASAVGALLAGCRHFFGYPITPSTEGTELLAELLPELDGYFVQAVSEVAAVNMMYGCGAAGLPTMTFTSSPGFSLMVEGISYMIGAEVPGVFVTIMRGGPGLGNIAPEQSDIKLVCRGLGHGNTFAPVLAPASPQEMLDLTMKAFEIAFKYRTPVIVAGDGYLGQITGRVELPAHMVRPGMPSWAVAGDEAHRANAVSSIHLAESDLEAHNLHLNEKYRRMVEDEQRADLYRCEDAEWLIVACNTPSRMAKSAVEVLRRQGILAGLFRPVSLWPFPVQPLLPLLDRIKGVLMVEAGAGQLEDEMRLALSYARQAPLPHIERVQRLGGMLPRRKEIVDKLMTMEAVHASKK